MADIVSTQVISDTSGVKYVVKMTNISDGSGESLVKKMPLSQRDLASIKRKLQVQKLKLYLI